MPARDENRPFIGEAGRIGRKSKRPRVGDGDPIVDVQFTRSVIVEQAECGVAALLNLGQYDAAAEGVDGAGRDEDNIALRNLTPLNQFDDRAARDRCPQFLWRYPALQTNTNLRAWFRRDDVPGFALAVRHAHCAREGIVRMDLD